ncbi:hypothetical protein V6N12_007709 [Hibiscus sabdariffa]|uniref:Uncharacterized protein n=1 Tax=Hibiscus sabdariffa TaxID=183260 RepID=A0ABR2F2J5_9ROSI
MVFIGFLDPGQVPSIIPKPIHPFQHYENGGKFWGYESPSYRILGSIYALATGFYELFKMGSYYLVGYMPWWRSTPISVVSFGAYHGFILLPDLLAWLGPYYVFGFMPWWRSTIVSVDSLGDYHGFILLANLLAWFCLRFLTIRDCYGLKVGEDGARIFSSLDMGWGGLILSVGNQRSSTKPTCTTSSPPQSNEKHRKNQESNKESMCRLVSDSPEMKTSGQTYLIKWFSEGQTSLMKGRIDCLTAI